MKLTNEKEMSEWAFYQCYNGNDTEEMRDLINDNYGIYCYCYFIKNSIEMRNKFTDKEWERQLDKELIKRINGKNPFL